MLRPSLSVREDEGVAGEVADVSRRARRWSTSACVSPEFMLRPSLSGPVDLSRDVAGTAGVAGVYAPAFVERRAWPPVGPYTGQVSPELMLRPSLSERIHRAELPRPLPAGVAGVYAPAFVERPKRSAVILVAGRVAGVYAPAFVERGARHSLRRSLCSGLRSGNSGTTTTVTVSPEFMLRPSLSAREIAALTLAPDLKVSPEFMLRPSLSEVHGHDSDDGAPTAKVSPEFMLRPSLSGGIPVRIRPSWMRRVAGVYAPAFVERL